MLLANWFHCETFGGWKFMNTLEEFKALVANYQTDKTLENALSLGNALLLMRRRHVDSASGDLVEADMTEDKFLRWFKISSATARRLKLLALWKKDVLDLNPSSLTDAYHIAEELNKAALQADNNEINRGGRPSKSDVDKSLELLQLAAQHWLASDRPRLEFVDRARMAVQA